MTVPCEPHHLLWHVIPDGLALYYFDRWDYSAYEGWLAPKEVLDQVGRLDSLAVYVDFGRVEGASAALNRNVFRLCKWARDFGGRIILCNTHPGVEEILQLLFKKSVPWLSIRSEAMPGGGLPDPAWLTWNDNTVAALARRVEEDQDFGLLPVLGDALEDAGCTHREVLGHCRDAGPHVRGCWVIRLLLGKP